MQNIKFRAYDKKLKKMFPVHSLEWNKITNSLARLSGVDIHDKDSDHEGDVYYGGPANKKTGTPPLDRYVLMQFTGLKDRNGKEIYENDVIKGERIVWTESQHFGEMAETKGIVIFTNGRFVLHDIDSGAQPDIAMGLNYHEVIGNIMEHPDLLEGIQDGA
jgi:uncharacterized phage protein (TIGR01671 family)